MIAQKCQKMLTLLQYLFECDLCLSIQNDSPSIKENYSYHDDEMTESVSVKWVESTYLETLHQGSNYQNQYTDNHIQ